MNNDTTRFMRIPLLFFMVIITGCSVFMAARQPDKKDLEVMKAGTPRSRVVEEFGQPVSTEIRDGKRVEVYSFVQGYSTAAKAGRAALHVATDVLTGGTSEIVSTPTETVFHGTEVIYEITYDGNDRVEKAVALTGKSEKKAPAGTVVPSRHSLWAGDFGFTVWLRHGLSLCTITGTPDITPCAFEYR